MLKDKEYGLTKKELNGLTNNNNKIFNEAIFYILFMYSYKDL